MLRTILLLAGSTLAVAQQYSITTVAGGAPPATPASAGSVSIGQPQRTTVDKAGNVYFSAGNSVFKMAGGSLTVVAGNSRAGFGGDGGPAVKAQLNGPQGLALDGAGNLYIADSLNNRVRIVAANGIINTFAGNGFVSPGGGPGAYGDGGLATAANLHVPQGLTVDSAGNVYIADTGDNTIRKVTTDGLINTIAGDSYPGFFADGEAATKAELNKPADVTIDSKGVLYIADTSNSLIRKVGTDGIMSTVAGSGAVVFSGDGDDALKAGLFAPVSVAVDSTGNLFVVENGDSRVRKVDTKGIITTLAGTGTAGLSGDGSDPTKAQMNYPTGIAIDGSGNLFVADTGNNRVRKIAGGSMTTVAGNGQLSYSGDNGTAVSAQMNSPQAVAADNAGNFYVADTANHVVRKIAKNGTITTLAGNGTAGNGNSQLNAPQGVAADTAGNVYISDTGNNRVLKVAAGGGVSTFAGSGTAGFGGDNGAAGSAQLYTPAGLAVDAAGNLYIADFSNNRVRKVTASGTISTVAGNGNSGFSGDGGAATGAQLNLPQAVAVDAAGNLYIGDTGNNRVRKVTAGGTISTLAGNGQPGFAGDGGPGVNAPLSNPVGIAADSAGTVFVSDGGSRVRKISSSGFISTIAGNGSTGYTGDGGAALAAQLNQPTGVAVDSTGNVYIADTANNAVRLLQPSASGFTLAAVTSGASNLSGPVAPGEVVVLYGLGLGPTSGVSAQVVNGVFGTTLAGTSVYFGSLAAPVVYTSSTQVTAVVPYGITGTSAQAFVTYQGQVSAAIPVTVTAVSPAVFTADGSGKGAILAVNPDGSLNGPGHPAKAGDQILLYATGLGQTNPASQDGLPGGVGAPLAQAIAPVTVTVGGTSATVNYAGHAPNIINGVMQVNVVIPSGVTPGAAAFVLKSGGASAQPGLTVFVN